MRKLRAAVLASMKKKSPTSASTSTHSPTTTPTKKQAPAHASSARDARAIVNGQSNYHDDNALRSRERNAEQSSRTNTAVDRRYMQSVFVAKKCMTYTSQHKQTTIPPDICTHQLITYRSAHSELTCCCPGPKLRSALLAATPPHATQPQGQRLRLSLARQRFFMFP